jgi:hypothetical protein
MEIHTLGKWIIIKKCKYKAFIFLIMVRIGINIFIKVGSRMGNLVGLGNFVR